MKEPEYYMSNGLSPIGAFKQGLISKEEYRGFLIGNIIKYTIRAGKKEDAVKDLNKAKHYLDFYLELVNNEGSAADNIKVTVNVDNDLDMETFHDDIKRLFDEVKKELTNNPIKEVPTDDPNIVEVKMSDAFYDEEGNLKTEARDAVKKYLLERRRKT